MEAEMKRYGLIGNPISKSLSPSLFQAGYNGTLSYELIEAEEFETSWRRFLEEYDAINVTAPFKEMAFSQAVMLAKNGYGSVSGPCFKTGASNLVVKADDGIHAHNTDFTGVILSVAEALFPGIVQECYGFFGEKAYIKIHQFVKQNLQEYYGRKPQALIVGCGGAGKAAAVAASEMGYTTVLMNRTESKAREYALDVSEYGFIVDPISDFKAAFRECELIIYTLPESIPDIALLSEEDYRGESSKPKVLLEANYKTPSFRQREGLNYVSGRQWLLYQAITGYGIMTGKTPDFQAMASAVK